MTAEGFSSGEKCDKICGASRNHSHYLLHEGNSTAEKTLDCGTERRVKAERPARRLQLPRSRTMVAQTRAEAVEVKRGWMNRTW